MPPPSLTPQCPSDGSAFPFPPRDPGAGAAGRGDAAPGAGGPLTRIRQSRAHQAQQLPLLLVVALTEQLPFLQHELVALLQAPLADAAAEAAQVVDALLGAHHQLAGRDGLQAPGALHREQPAWGKQGETPLGCPEVPRLQPGGGTVLGHLGDSWWGWGASARGGFVAAAMLWMC